MLIKKLVPLFNVRVHRDITATVQAQVPEHELVILQTMHGDSNVYPGEGTGTNSALDADTEYDRLCRKYGKESVHEAYGVTAERDIRRLVVEASVGDIEDDHNGIQLEGPDTPAIKHSLPASDVQRPKAKARAMAAA